MSVSHLARLLESGDFRRCLSEAAALLEAGECDTETLARIQAVLCRSRLGLTDYNAAIEAGQQAVDLAGRVQSWDVLGFALLDLGTALIHVRRYDEALGVYARYLSALPSFTAAQCAEGAVRERLAGTLMLTGRPAEAQAEYWQAHRWFERFGDDRSAQDCVRAIVRIHLAQGQLLPVPELLARGTEHARAHPGDREFLAEHLLDWAQYYQAASRLDEAVRAGWQALSLADDRAVQQARAQLLLCQIALAQDRPADGLSFALAARVTAIDGKLYDLEFEASEILFRLLRIHGPGLLRELESDFAQQGVNIYHYLSEPVLQRMELGAQK